MPVSLIIALAAGIYLLSCLIFANMITRSHRQPVVRSPQDYGMPFEEGNFKSQDGLAIKHTSAVILNSAS